MTIFILICIAAAGVIGGVMCAISIAREDGALRERLEKLQKDADYAKKQADVMVKEQTADEVADSLDRGKF